MSQAFPDVQIQVRNWQQVAAAIDHTLFKPDTTREQIVQLSEEAIFFGFAAIAVNPCWISLAASILHGTPVKVATTIGFPLGANLSSVKRFEAFEAVRLGAQELDMVINIGALKSGDRTLVQSEIVSVVEIAHSHNAIIKVLLETQLLTTEENIVTCR